MIKRRTWEEFRDNGLLWWINMILHTFGWAIAFEEEKGKIVEVYPVRTRFRGFTGKINDEGYIKVSKYLRDNADDLYAESKE